MHVTPGELIVQREDPEALERLYRSDPAEFRRSLDEALRVQPASLLLRAWHARLDSTSSPEPSRAADPTAIPLLLFLIIVSGTAAKLPLLFGRYDDVEPHTRNVGFYFLPAIAA